MSRTSMLDRFVEKNPLAVMTRSIVGAVIDERFNDLFEQNRGRQYDDTIKFSIVAMSVADIALGTVENRNQAYNKYKEELGASVTAYYGKLNRTEPGISEAVVSFSAEQATRLLSELDFQEWEVLPGYRCYTLDGNHLQKTEKRLQETRGLCAAPLPGTIVGRFDLQSGLFDRGYLLEDAHAQESVVLDRVVEDLQAHDLVLADRHFCITKFMLDVAACNGCFLIRQHGRLKGELLGKRRCIGKTDTGIVYEQSMRIGDKDSELVVRRITVILNEPTRDGDTEIHLLSNVPRGEADGCKLADLYRQRWEIENAFYILTMTLTCEVKSNCYPRCALFLFCMAMLAYNCRQVLLAALYAEHAQDDVEQMSQYRVALDIVRPMEGMLTAINEQEWETLTRHTPAGAFLRRVSRHVDVRSYRKSVRGPKRKQPPRKRCKAGTHLSTAKLLESRKQRC